MEGPLASLLGSQEDIVSLLEKYRLAFEISPVPMLLAQEDGEIVLTNSALCALFE